MEIELRSAQRVNNYINGWKLESAAVSLGIFMIYKINLISPRFQDQFFFLSFYFIQSTTFLVLSIWSEHLDDDGWTRWHIIWRNVSSIDVAWIPSRNSGRRQCWTIYFVWAWRMSDVTVAMPDTQLSKSITNEGERRLRRRKREKERKNDYKKHR